MALPVTIAKPDSAKGEVSFGSPLLLPDARSVLYTVRLKDGTSRIDARRLDQNRVTTIVDDAFGPRYQASGYLVFGRGDRLMAARFDAATLKVSGEPSPCRPPTSS